MYADAECQESDAAQGAEIYSGGKKLKSKGEGFFAKLLKKFK